MEEEEKSVVGCRPRRSNFLVHKVREIRGGGERYFCFLSPPPAFLYPRSGEEDYLPSSSFLLLRMVGWLPREEGRQREGRRVETKFVPLRPHDYAGGGGGCIHGHWGEQTYINYVHISPLRYSRRTTEYAQSMAPVPTYAEETRQAPGKRPPLTFHGQSLFFTLECTYLRTTHWLVLEETR